MDRLCNRNMFDAQAAFDEAVRCDNVAIVLALHNRGVDTSRALCIAAKHESVGVFEQLVNRIYATRCVRTSLIVAKSKNRQMLKVSSDNHILCIGDVCTLIAERNYVNLIDWIHSENMHYDEWWLAEEAARSGSIDILTWMRVHTNVFTDYMAEFLRLVAHDNAQTQVLKWLTKEFPHVSHGV